MQPGRPTSYPGIDLWFYPFPPHYSRDPSIGSTLFWRGGDCKGNPHLRTHHQLTTAKFASPARGRPGPAGRSISLPRTSLPADPRPDLRPLVDAHFPSGLMYIYGLSRTLFLVRFLFALRCSLALASH